MSFGERIIDWTERTIDWQYEVLSESFGEWPALILMLVLPPACWAVIVYALAGLLWSVVALIVVAIFWVFMLVILASRTVGNAKR